MSSALLAAAVAGARETRLDALCEALGSRGRSALELAEQVVRDFPGDPVALDIAALAALMEDRPERCLVYLKRLSKRYHPKKTEHLLHALAMAQQGRRGPAARLLERHGIADFNAAARLLPVNGPVWGWLAERLQAIRLGRQPGAAPGAKATARPATRPGAARTAKAARPARPAPVPPAAARPAAPPRTSGGASALPRTTVRIPVEIELSLAEASALGPAADDGPAWFRLRAELAQLSLARGFDELLCLPHLRDVDLYPHQVETARKVLKQFRGRVLLADEVGLGKTIEAGMVLKEYLLRGMAERVLVLTPASLVGQWREEIEGKFDIACATTHDALLRADPERFWDQPRVIASIAVARRKEHFGRIVRRSYDLVVVDEAHHLKNRASRNYQLVDALKKRFLLLLSATPVQNNLIELYNLLTLLQPGIFKTEKEFRSAYMTPGRPRVPANRDRMRDLMRGAMVRNTRALVALKLPRRHALTRRVDGSAAEAECYRELSRLAREAGRPTAGDRLALHHLLSAAGSSPSAAAAALGRFAARHPGDARWSRLRERHGAIALGAKEAALLELLESNPDEKKMLFVHHRETLLRLDALLEARGIRFTRFDGSLSGPAKDAAIATFRDRVPVLLCTESGGEGRNVQFCNTLINFDIPWNPMAIEQRIGRIDRIGQQREVFVFNLAMRDTVEDQVLAILDEKINMFELVVGEVGAILGELDEDRDFAAMVLGAWLESGETERETAFSEVGRQIVDARRRYDEAKALDDELFGEEFETA